MINPLRMILAEERVKAILPQSSIQVFTIISQTRLLDSVFAEYESSFNKQVLNWLSNKA